MQMGMSEQSLGKTAAILFEFPWVPVLTKVRDPFETIEAGLVKVI